jgi:N-sulfoglucosamine sulfohydrolase
MSMNLPSTLSSRAAFRPCSLALVGLLSLLVLTATAASPKPNIVVFLSDDHGQLDSTPYGATDVRTPAMHRLADQGLTFTRAFIASPACAPSRAALLTGLMPARNGAEANHAFKRDTVRSLPENLRELGYQTAAFGKVAHNKADTLRHGFDVSDEKYDAATVEKFLRERDSAKPLCLLVGTQQPHVPWPRNDGYDPAKVTLPPTFVDTPETRAFRCRYYTDVTQADTELGEILALAQKHVPATNTLFLYTSDHGAQWPFGKWNLYDSGMAVPMIAVWPGVIPPGHRTAAMVQWIDLLPTFIEAAGGRSPEGIDGKSFLPVLLGRQDAHREVIFTTHSGDGRMNVYPIRAVRTGDWKLILNLHPEFAHTTHIDKALARDGGAYWISWFEAAKTNPAAAATVRRYHERPAVELYDLHADPFETNNLAAAPTQAARVKELRSQLEAWMRQQGDQQTVFNQPRLLANPAATRPGRNSGADTATPGEN